MYAQFKWTAVSLTRAGVQREYEPLQPHLLMELAEQAGCKSFLDIGANVGFYSLFISSLSGIEKVFAFEPTESTARELKENIRINGLEARIAVREVALSNRTGATDLGIISEHSGANSIVSTTIHNPESFKTKRVVQTAPLDTLQDIFPEGPVCIKIDVEGHELEVVSGAEHFLTTRSAIVQVEDYSRAGQALKALQKLGYKFVTKVGPDLYVSNIVDVVNPRLVKHCFERACERMIEDNHNPLIDSSNQPILIKPFTNVAIRITGSAAASARRALAFFERIRA